MTIKRKVLSGVLCLLMLTTVVLLGVARADSYDNGISNNPLAKRNQILRGRYLITAVAGCADCHSATSRTPNDPKWLAGYINGTPGQPFEVGPLRIYPANITPDKQTGIGNWSPQQVFNTLRQGKDDEGHVLCPPMPWPYYRNMSDRDTWAIVAYLRSIEPVRNEVPPNTAVGAPAGTEVNCSPLYKNLESLPPYPGTNEIGKT